MLFDSHCHLTDPAFSGERDAVLERAREAGVVGFVCIASDPADAEAARAVATDHPDVWFTAGVHPHEAGGADAAELEAVARLAASGDVVAVGECGLDFHYDNAPRERQREVFRDQLETAAEAGLPVVVHSRSADEETAGLVREYGERVKGVLHCFTGGDALLDAALERGWYVSFSGIVTFDGFDGGARVRRVPDDRLLVETDSPYLAPAPHRGKRNEPAHVARVAEVVAGIRGTTVEALGPLTTRNAHRFYGLPIPSPGE